MHGAFFNRKITFLIIIIRIANVLSIIHAGLFMQQINITYIQQHAGMKKEP
jgi:hypothetical protein